MLDFIVDISAGILSCFKGIVLKFLYFVLSITADVTKLINLYSLVTKLYGVNWFSLRIINNINNNQHLQRYKIRNLDSTVV